jgi:2-dehydro-3-deoxyphosphogluconate aldolase/(4S)-4-hydroxy-2-oxoglutarate aldolase
MADDVLKMIGEIGLVPVIKIEDPKDAVPLVKALQAGDLPVAEVTFRTAAAEIGRAHV